jgi:hypothetical protein
MAEELTPITARLFNRQFGGALMIHDTDGGVGPEESLAGILAAANFQRVTAARALHCEAGTEVDLLSQPREELPSQTYFPQPPAETSHLSSGSCAAYTPLRQGLWSRSPAGLSEELLVTENSRAPTAEPSVGKLIDTYKKQRGLQWGADIRIDELNRRLFEFRLLQALANGLGGVGSDTARAAAKSDAEKYGREIEQIKKDIEEAKAQRKEALKKLKETEKALDEKDSSWRRKLPAKYLKK